MDKALEERLDQIDFALKNLDGRLGVLSSSITQSIESVGRRLPVQHHDEDLRADGVYPQVARLRNDRQAVLVLDGRATPLNAVASARMMSALKSAFDGHETVFDDADED